MHVLNHLPGKPDAANMLRGHVTAAVHAALEAGRRARLDATTLDEWLPTKERWLAAFRAAFPPELFAMCDAPLNARTLARHERDGYTIETVLFESLWGWEVNAHLCLPAGKGPWSAVVCPTGHSAKTQPSYQVPPVVLARNGLAAIAFDAPGQGEKNAGNDHFDQGVACLLTGLWTQTFFAMDALRAIDYLVTRADIDASVGVGMTGVSGGGETTMTCALLDERIRCIAPVCCTGPQRVLGAQDMYTSCPETMGRGLFAAGIDVVEKLALAAPTPCLIVNAGMDEVYYPAMVAEVAAELRHTYALYGCPERLEHFQEPGVGHAYTAVMAERVAAWMRRWLVGDSAPTVGLSDPDAVTEPPEVINCGPRPKPNMQTINAERATTLKAERRARDGAALREAARELLAVGDALPLAVDSAASEMSWRHRVERVAVQSDRDVWVPLLWLGRVDVPGRRPVILWVDDRGKWEALQQEGWLLDAAAFLQDEPRGYRVCCVDVRGWGETAPEHVAYDFAGWNDITRILAYLSNALGRCLTGQRARDVLAVLAYLRTREDADAERIVIGGRGAGALVALWAALLGGEVAGFLGVEMLASYELLTQAEGLRWTHDVFVPDVLQHCDVPDLLGALHCPALVLNAVGANRETLRDVSCPSGVEARACLPEHKLRGEALAWVRRTLGA